MASTTPSALAALSQDLAAAVERIAPSVVYVDADPRRDASGLVWDEHLIVTVDHVIEREDEIELVLGAGSKARATLVGRDPTTDLALLRCDSSLQPAPQAEPAALRVGHLALAVARDEDGQPAASFGVISALDGPWRTWRGGDIDRFIRPDLSLYPGFSGGPLVDAEGRVIGLNTWGLSRRTGLTLPPATLARVVAQLATGGRIRRGYLGVAMQAVRLPQSLRAALGIEQSGGAIVVDVAGDGPADRAGITIGDVLIALGGQSVEDSDDVQRALAGDSVGTAQTLRVVRAGALRDVEVAIGERPRDDE